MNKLQTKAKTLDSREVAQMVNKRHADLIRDIEKYHSYLENTNERNFALVDFFVKSSYRDNKGEYRPCYQITKKGCELIAHKMTGKKGVQFTASYINRFHEMEDAIKQVIPTLEEAKAQELKIRQDRATAMLLNAQNRMIKTLLSNTKDKNLSQIAIDVMGIKAVEQITGKNMNNYLPECEKLYSATEVGNMLGVTATRIGKTANACELKTDEYGKTVMSKSRNSAKEVSQFLYNEKGVQALAEILGKSVKTA